MYVEGMADICGICKREIEQEANFCSGFCAVTTKEEREAFLALEPGVWGVWPCTGCGNACEGDWKPDAECLSCYDDRQEALRIAVLKETLPYLPDDLAARVRAVLPV